MFSQFEPSVFTIKRLAVPEGATREIREGYIPALTLGLGIAAAVVFITRSYLPLIMAVAVAAFTIAVYEWAIRTAEGPI